MWYLLQSAVILGLMYFYLNDPTTRAPPIHIIIFCVFVSYVVTWFISVMLDLLLGCRRVVLTGYRRLTSQKSGGSRLGTHVKRPLPNLTSRHFLDKRR